VARILKLFSFFVVSEDLVFCGSVCSFLWPLALDLPFRACYQPSSPSFSVEGGFFGQFSLEVAIFVAASALEWKLFVIQLLEVLSVADLQLYCLW
jgi:hypothetical protein